MGGSGVQRPLKFAKYLKEYGWNPIIVCPLPGAYQFFDDELEKEVEVSNLEVHRVNAKTPFHSLGSSGKKTGLITGKFAKYLRLISRKIYFPDNKKGWIEPAILKASELISLKKIDVIYSTAPPFSNHIIGERLSKKYNIPLVVDYRDLFLGNHFEGTVSASTFKRKLKLEQGWLTEAKGITVLDSYAAEIISNFEDSVASKIKVLPHGFDPADFESPEKSTLDYKLNKLNVLYSGLFYESNQPDVFLKAWKKLIEKKPEVADKIHLHFQGGLDQRIKRIINELGLTNVVSDYGYVSHQVAVNNLLKADILWMISNFDVESKQIKSGKLFEYLGAEKPILALVHSGEAKKLMEQYGASYVASPTSVEEVSSVLLTIYKDWVKKLIPNVNSDLVQKHNRQYLTKELSTFFDYIIEHSDKNS